MKNPAGRFKVNQTKLPRFTTGFLIRECVKEEVQKRLIVTDLVVRGKVDDIYLSKCTPGLRILDRSGQKDRILVS